MAQLQNLTINNTDIFDLFYPIGSIYETSNADFNPNNVWSGTWERIKGKVIVGVDENDNTFASSKLTGGEKTHTLTVAEMPSHVGHLNSNDGYTYIGTGIGLYLAPTTMTTYSGSYGRGWNNAAGEIYPAGISRGGAEVTTICRLILPFVYGVESLKKFKGGYAYGSA